MGLPESIVLKSQDGVRIAGTYLNADQPRAAALLLHMMPATKESWSAFASRLSGLGIASLAIDLRGHGASTQGPGGPLDYRLFDDHQHQAARLDADAGLAWLRERHPGLHLLAVGASIGANLALQAMADHADVSAVLALSPGLEYRGIETEEALSRLRAGQRAMLVASREDSYAFKSVEQLKEKATRAQVETVIVEAASHGTAILERDSALAARASTWLKSTL